MGEGGGMSVGLSCRRLTFFDSVECVMDCATVDRELTISKRWLLFPSFLSRVCPDG